MNALRTPRKSALSVVSAVLLTVVLGTLAFAIKHIKPGVPFLRHTSGQTLTEVQFLPTDFWGFGSTPINLPIPTGATINGGSSVSCGFFVIVHRDLRVWSLYQKTGNHVYRAF